MVALDDLAALFQLSVREDALAGGVTVDLQGQERHPHAGSGAGLGRRPPRLAALRRPSRDGRRWLVPVEFISRALSARLRRQARRPEELAARARRRRPRAARRRPRRTSLGPQTRVTLTVSPQDALHDLAGSGPRPGALRRRRARRRAAGVRPAGAAAVDPRWRSPARPIAIDVGPRFGSFRASLVPQDDGGQVVVDLMPAGGRAGPPPPPRGGAAAVARPAAAGRAAARSAGGRRPADDRDRPGPRRRRHGRRGAPPARSRRTSRSRWRGG